MAKKVFTDASLSTLISEIKSYSDNAMSNHGHEISDVNNLSDTLNNFYTKNAIDNMVFITVDNIDAICNATISVASFNGEVRF